MSERKNSVVFPTLFKSMANGLVQRWDIQVKMATDDIPAVVCTHGTVDGKLVEESRLVKAGKNIGRSNETSPWDQAVSEAKSKWTHMMDKGYRETPSSTDKPVLPMLAKEYKSYRHRIIMPCHVQPKLNGVRCVASLQNEVPYLMSRGGKPIRKFDHIRSEISLLLQNIETSDFYLDGEIFKPGLSLQKIAGASRKEKDDVREEIDSIIEYHVYDCFRFGKENWPFADRYAHLRKLLNSRRQKHIKLVKTVRVKNESEAMRMYKEWLSRGYEGIMFRNSGASYKIGHRSMDLQKHKPFVDDEFEIVGAHEGAGNDAGTIVWECVTKKKKRFSVKPEGDRDTRKWYWEHRKEYIGKKITVKYQELSDEGVPIFPVGVAIRDYE